MFLFHFNVPLSFTVLSGLSGGRARKPVPCVSRSEGVVYFQYNKIFQDII